MRYFIIFLLTIFFYFQGFTQVVPNVSIDTLAARLFPIYSQALKSGVYNLPRDTSWEKLKEYNFPGISIRVPERWLNLGGLGSVVEAALDASGLYFSDTLNNRPILAGIFILNQLGDSLEEAKNLAFNDYRLNADRVFESNYLDSVYMVNLLNGEKGYVLHTRFLRKSSQLNQSRYDLILFSKRLKKAYSVMISIQYSDPSYFFEKSNALGLFAVRLFSQVRLE